MHERTSVVLIEALTRVWSRIRVHHPEVPGVMLLAAPSLRRDLSVLGHFAPLRWRHKEKDGVKYHEVVVVAEHLDRNPADIVETLLHEAAHALNFGRGIKDCTRSQYHNQHFKAAAEELGLAVEQVKNYGFAFTRLKSDTISRYEEDTRQLAEVLIHRAKPVMVSTGTDTTTGNGGDTDDDRPTSRNRRATCRCPFIIRVSKSTLDNTSIRCESCGEVFKLA
jgi:hypothetical protein